MYVFMFASMYKHMYVRMCVRVPSSDKDLRMPQYVGGCSNHYGTYDPCCCVQWLAINGQLRAVL